jgi:hypothetical protein
MIPPALSTCRICPVLYDSIWHVAAADKVGHLSEAEAAFGADCVAEQSWQTTSSIICSWIHVAAVRWLPSTTARRLRLLLETLAGVAPLWSKYCPSSSSSSSPLAPSTKSDFSSSQHSCKESKELVLSLVSSKSLLRATSGSSESASSIGADQLGAEDRGEEACSFVKSLAGGDSATRDCDRVLDGVSRSLSGRQLACRGKRFMS